jgi:hypothetical protein
VLDGEAAAGGNAAEAGVVDDTGQPVFDAGVGIADEELRQDLDEVDAIGAGVCVAGCGAGCGEFIPLGHDSLRIGPGAVVDVESADVGEQVLSAGAEDPLGDLRLNPDDAAQEQEEEEDLADAFSGETHREH